MSHLRVQKDGKRVGVVCDHEPEGDSTERDLQRAYASKMAAILTAKHTGPRPGPNGEIYEGIAEPVESAITVISPLPVVLIRGGVAVAVSLTGVGFTASDTIVYGATGITNATPPALVSATSRTLSVQASGGMATGMYTLTFNSTLFQAVFDVR